MIDLTNVTHAAVLRRAVEDYRRLVDEQRQAYERNAVLLLGEIERLEAEVRRLVTALELERKLNETQGV